MRPAERVERTEGPDLVFKTVSLTLKQILKGQCYRLRPFSAIDLDQSVLWV